MCNTHHSGNSLCFTRLAIILVGWLMAGPLWASLPSEIPTPTFGWTNTAPDRPNPWNSAVGGFYYVNFQSGNDTGNTWGTPTSPRATIPASPTNGAVIEVHGTNSSSAINIRTSSADPIWIKGQDSNSICHFRGDTYVGATNLIFQNIWFRDDATTSNGVGGYVFMDIACDKVAFIDCEVSGELDSGGVGVGTFGNVGVHRNITFLRPNIHHCGDYNATIDQDRHGIAIGGGGASNIWVDSPWIRMCSGDGIQINGGPSAANNTNTHDIFIFDGLIFSNKQTCAWSKQADRVVFARNFFHSAFGSDSSPTGPATGSQYDANRITWSRNIISNCNEGIRISGGDTTLTIRTNHVFVGNLIINCRSNGIVLAGGLEHRIHNNTIANVSFGIECPYSSFTIDMANNILFNCTNLAYNFDGVPTGGQSKNNLIFNSFGDARFNWGSLLYTGIVALAAASGREQGTLSNNPVFVSSTDFRLQSASPAKDTGITPSTLTFDPYGDYQSLFGLSIARDIDGTARPFNSAWDIGAFEFTASGNSGTGSAILSGAIISGGRVR